MGWGWDKETNRNINHKEKADSKLASSKTLVSALKKILGENRRDTHTKNTKMHLEIGIT